MRSYKQYIQAMEYNNRVPQESENRVSHMNNDYKLGLTVITT